MREKLLYTVSISERDYTGEITELKPIGEELSITQGQIDDNELVPTKASELVLSLLCTEEGDPLTQLFTIDPTQYLIDVGVCRKTSDGYDVCMTLWSGYISTGGYSQPYAKPPYRVTLRANDGLAILKTIPYLDDDGSLFTGVKSIKAHISDIMSKIAIRPVRVWSAWQLRVGQTEDTFEAIGLSQEAIYSAFNGTPTCYEVLESILSTFGLQLFQSYGTWIARPLSALISKRRPEWYSNVSEGFGLGTAERTLPLYGSAADGYGMSTSAVMSLNPPLKDVTSTAEAPTYVVYPPSAKNPRLWGDNSSLGNSAPRRGSEGVILHRWREFSTFKAAGHTFSPILSKSEMTELTLSFKVFNREDKSATVDYLVALVPQEVEDTWIENLPSVSGLEVWDEDKKEWSKTKLKTMSFDLPAHSYDIRGRRVSRADMEKTAVEVSCTVKAIPTANRRLGFAISSFRTCEIYDVKIEVKNNGITFEGDSVPFVISPYGRDTLEIEQKYTSSEVLPLISNDFLPTIVDMTTLEPIAGMLSPADTSSIAGAVASGLQAMRGGVTRTLKGDIYVPKPIDLNTLWRDRDGRAYYTNYVQTLAKRGVYNVQLCELSPLTDLEDDAVPIPSQGSIMLSTIGLGNAVVYQSLSSSGLWMTDVNNGKTILLHAKNAPYLYVRRGYRCICAIDYTTSGTAHKIVCSAYDAAGTLLSSAELDSMIIADLVTSSIHGIVDTICYDKLCDVWYCAYWNGNYIRTAIFDSTGTRLFWANIAAITTEPTKIAVHAVNNGFILSYTTTQGNFVHIHNNAMHQGSTCSKSASVDEVLAVADKYIVFQNDTQISVKPRTEIEVVSEGGAVATFNITEYSYVAHNQILLVLVKNSDKSLKVLDLRTLREVDIVSKIFRVSVWLNGEFIRQVYNNKIHKMRISDGDGYISNGNNNL